MPGRFEFYKDKSGEYRFRLMAGNGDVVLSSDGYKSKLGCMKGIDSVRVNSSNPDNYVREPGKSGGHRFKLLSLNGRVLCVSRVFETAAAYNSSINSVAKLARGAVIDDKT
ncbi:MAG: YegP family protein [Gammaproteobacteria bacterium]|nr:YegP family protein [Gammaproteobacteria bacterium]MDH4315238.1 YegP family protein [Gammaproteobacteria bacterium]MDH5215018.1 YegP family protein [Gammaproteobacteria bacterium]MDH5501821.1 YegP family protein [Gammaproteobacteria bacterium]